jgi:hypothetical protein
MPHKTIFFARKFEFIPACAPGGCFSLHHVGGLLANIPLGLLASLNVLELEDSDVVVLSVLLPVLCERVKEVRRTRNYAYARK